MRLPLRFPRDSGPGLDCRAVGHALLIHPRGEPSPRAVLFAGGLAEDLQHTLVVVDLPAGSDEAVWESVARVLSGRPGSFRLVFGRGAREEIKTAGQWLADRLKRVVLAPDGEVLPAAGGALFVPADRGSGWLRFRPGKASEWDSQRFPKPFWELSAANRSWETSLSGMVEPLPGGVWLHGRQEEPGRPANRRRLVDSLPCRTDRFAVVLGSPGAPALPLADVARFWDSVLPSARALVRFVPYGPVGLPEGGVLGQGLADALNQPVVLYAGLPVQSRRDDAPDVHVVREDGSLGWRPFARELAYVPATATHGRVAPPALFGCRAPVDGVAEISAGVYEYAPEAVLEVIQSGLWLRPPEEPPNGNEIRSVPPSTGHATILFDQSSPATAERMRTLAEDVLDRLDPAARESFRVTPADGPAAALLVSGAKPWHPPTTGSSEPAKSPAVTTGRPATAFSAPLPSAAVAATVSAPLSETAPVLPPATDGGTETGTAAAAEVAAGGATLAAPGLAPSEPPLQRATPATDSPESAEAPASAGGSAPGGPAPGEPSQPSTAPLSTSGPASGTGTETATAGPAARESAVGTGPVGGVSAPSAPSGAPAPPRPARSTAPRIRLESAPLPDLPSPELWAPAPAEPDPAGGGEPAEPASVPAPAEEPKRSGMSGSVRVQPVPQAAASAVLPERGIDKERAWLRQTLSEQYNAIAGSVSRVLSESPGLRGGSRASAADALTDLVAVRLYLSGQNRRVDRAVLSATAGPHVPLARCVAAGLRRLPSFRGAAVLCAALGEAERRWYHEGRLVTEWGFCTGLTTAHPDPPGDTDFLIWSMTARRTALLDPAVPDRVLFLPGTSFKVLAVRAGERHTVLLRELSRSEIGADGRVSLGRVPLDEIALTSLEQIERVSEKAGTERTRPAYAGVPGNPPGLIARAYAPRPHGTAGPATPREGARP